MSPENLHPMRGLTPSTVSPLNPTPYEGAALAQDELSSPVSRDFQTDRLGPYSPRFLVKRAVDIVGALVGLTLLTPVMMAIALLVRLDSPGPAFFGQLRRGHRGRLFRVFKFRTMIADAEQRLPELENSNESRGGVLFKLREDPRVTPLGRFLRRHSLDELPQLINVLWGEMSLVGPRPLQLRDSDRLLASKPRRLFPPPPGGAWADRPLASGWTEQKSITSACLSSTSITSTIGRWARTCGSSARPSWSCCSAGAPIEKSGGSRRSLPNSGSEPSR